VEANVIRLLFYILLFYVIYRLVKSRMGRWISGSEEREIQGTDAELIRDPQCGTYFLKRRGVSAVVRGEAIYFCSERCRDAYLAAQTSSEGDTRK
jgi:YHS domain-containing protein